MLRRRRTGLPYRIIFSKIKRMQLPSSGSVKSYDVVIVGAGIIGLSAAYELGKKGLRVAVIDQAQPGFGCSYGNAGWLTPCFALPLPMPGMLLKSLRWLLDPLSPLHIQPHLNLRLIKWLLRFLVSMNPQQAMQSVAALTELSTFSLQRYSELEKETGHSIGFKKKGLLLVGLTKSGHQSAVDELKWVSPFGIPGKSLTEAETHDLEPAITGKIHGGVYFPNEAYCEPLQAVRAFAHGASRYSVEIFPSTEVYEFQTLNRKINSVRTTHGVFQAKQFVLATGSWSHALTRPLHLEVPILGGKGYALILKPLQPSPQIPMMIVERKVAVTPREDSIRIAGTLELVHQDYSIQIKRVQGILNGARKCLNIPDTPEILELWRGLRPCTPDGVPIIGFSKQFSNLLIAAGHQMLGLQTAPGTARLVCDLITEATPSFDPMPFRATRFSF